MSFFVPPAAGRSCCSTNCKDQSITAYAVLRGLPAARCFLHEHLVATDSAGLLVVVWHPLDLRASYNNAVVDGRPVSGIHVASRTFQFAQGRLLPCERVGECETLGSRGIVCTYLLLVLRFDRIRPCASCLVLQPPISSSRHNEAVVITLSSVKKHA